MVHEIKPLEMNDIYSLVAIINKLDIDTVIKKIDIGSIIEAKSAAEIKIEALRSEIITPVGEQDATPEEIEHNTKINSQIAKINNDLIYKVAIDVMSNLSSMILGSILKIKDDVNKFIADKIGMTGSKVGKMKPTEFIEILGNIMHDPEFPDFFKAALKLIKPELMNSMTESTNDTEIPNN